MSAEKPVFRAAGCRVETQPYDEHSRLVSVYGEAGATATLEAPGYRHTRLTDLVRKRHLSWQDGSVEIEIPGDGRAWLMVFDPPPDVSIFDYRPEPLLEVPGSEPVAARFPVVDVHAHLGLGDADAAERVRLMNSVNVAVAITGGFADRGDTTADTARRFVAAAPGRFLAAATVDWSLVRRTNGGALLAERLHEDVTRHGAVLVNEAHDKGFGVDDHGVGPVPADPIHLDDLRLDPFWAAAAELGVPVIVHCGDDIATYRPWDARNEALRRLYRAPWSRRRPGGLSQQEVHARRDRVLTRFPRLRLVAAHLDGYGERLDVLAASLRRHPNLYVELGARHRVLARQPRHAARFLREFAGRVLFGGDRAQDAGTYREQFRVLETDDDAFAPLDPVDPGPLYGLDLPDDVLTELYRDAAARMLPGVAALLSAPGRPTA
ncbi:hypothetical protein C6361_01810 [Plantactinospora sp. BC1]|uniref:amidohydrolase family protein n=1 Tax=Plantactinospora sp. BC1 TaxID=2108470 RepID=UPI000D174060|nr:amidohydrolase family protein [Plantactinospora sp. BC1]AVT28443.1 hypothetical protein C6361_01810 [Plantactinospora sp. BC1]